MAGNVLRELIARVVLRMDEQTFRRLDTQLDQARGKLGSLQSEATRGVNVAVSVASVEAQNSFLALRTAMQAVNTEMSPAQVAGYAAALATAETQASKLRVEVDRLKETDPTSTAIQRVEQQIVQFQDLRQEITHTSAAIVKLGSGLDMGALDRWAADAARGSTAVKANLKEAEESTKRMPGLLGKLSSAWGALGLTIGAVGLIGFVSQTLEAAGAVEDLADRLDMGIEEVQVWSAFARQGGASNEDLSTSTKGLANAMQGVVNGGKEQKAAFDALGISTDGWDKKLPPLTETLALVGGRLSELDNGGQRLALTQKLLSEGGLKLGPAFKGGTEAVQEHLEKLKELAVVYSDDFVKSAGEAGDELDLFYGQFRGLGSELILTFLPALRGAVRELTPVIRGLRDGFAHSELFKGSLVSAGALGLASFGGLGGALARFAPLLGRLAVMAAPFIWAFAKFAVLTLFLDDFFVMLNGGKSVLGEFLSQTEAGRSILDSFQQAFKLLKGSVLLLWGALSGDQDAIDKGKTLLDEFSAWIDGFVANVGFMFTDLFTRVIPQVVDEGLGEFDESVIETFNAISKFVSQWAGELGGIIGGVWDAAISGLRDMLNGAAKLLSKIPGFGGLDPDAPPPPPGDSPAAPFLEGPANALASGANPYLPAAGPANVTINNNQQVTTTIGAGNPKDVVNAVDRVGRNVTTAIEKDNRQTKRLVVGASR